RRRRPVMAPRVAPAGNRGPRRWAAALLLAVLALTGAAVALRFRPRPPPAVAAADPDEDLDALIIPRNPGYLGPQACAACHAARVAQMQTTRHFRACRVPRPGDMPPG